MFNLFVNLKKWEIQLKTNIENPQFESEDELGKVIC